MGGFSVGYAFDFRYAMEFVVTHMGTISSRVSSASVTATGCSITSAVTVSTTATTGCLIRRAAFFTGARLDLALATVRFAALTTLRALLRLAEFALRSLARPCTLTPSYV